MNPWFWFGLTLGMLLERLLVWIIAQCDNSLERQRKAPVVRLVKDDVA